MLLFFFSSRRRHTRLQGDWSSDVCSSDLLKCCGSFFKRQTWFGSRNYRHMKLQFIGSGCCLIGRTRACETHGGFLRLGLPICATKALGSRGIPLGCFAILPRGLKKFRQFKSDHSVARLLIEIRKLRGRVFSGTSAANASSNLFPVSHTVRAL